MKLIGLTGSIATGKSTVARLIESLGYPVIDADRISHQCTKIGEEGYFKIIENFGETILNEKTEIDRLKLGQLVFNEPTKRKLLEDLLHPLIQQKVLDQKSELSKKHQMAFYDIPLLFEKNLQKQFDQIITVYCDEKVRLDRLMKRNKLDLDSAKMKIKSQLDQSVKIAGANYCIDNSGPEEHLIYLAQKALIKISN